MSSHGGLYSNSINDPGWIRSRLRRGEGACSVGARASSQGIRGITLGQVI